MDKEFVPYDELLELKAIGFNEPCCGYYIELRNPSEGILTIDKRENINDGVSAPTFSQAFRWFREKYEIAGEVNNYYSDGKWSYNYDIVTKYKEKASDMFDKHEDAELACLKKLIEIVKNK